ncbi:response regulator [Dyadobacter bucti]|uniref:response regulator n=1 Tax=Dyadobacter bucti TaxID=2572203 RepID=UPI003F6F7C45
MIKVAIFDDHTERRAALRLLLSLDPELECVGDYANCRNLVERLHSSVPDVVLMDIDMPEVDGIEGVKLVQRHFPATHIIMQTVFEDNEKIFDSILAGAHGYILKKTKPDKLIEGIHEVVNGGSPMTASIARKVLQFFREKPADENQSVFNLSDREIEILGQLVKGLSHKMIAAELNISPFTVNNHIKKIYQKLHVHNASEAVATALKNRIV